MSQPDSPHCASSATNEDSANMYTSELRIQLILLGLFRFSEAVAWTSIFPYVYFMVQSFGDGSKTNPALGAGALVAAFTFSEFMSGIVWSKISDHIGRKPTLLIGVLGGLTSALCFGFSRYLWMALAARAIGGLLNPNIGVVQTCLGELVKRKDHQAKAFSFVPFLRGLGGLLGPVLGGNLAEPVKRFPSIFSSNTIWDQYPYLLPNIVVCFFLAATGLLGLLFLNETHPKPSGLPAYDRKFLALLKKNISLVLGRKVPTKYSTLQEDDESEASEQPLAVERGSEIELENLNGSDSTADDFELNKSSPVASRAFTPQTILQILSVSLLAFHKVSSDVLIPILLATSPSPSPTKAPQRRDAIRFTSGFGLSSANIGLVLLSQAVIATAAQFLVVSRIITRFGPLGTYRGVLFIFPWIYAILPFFTRLPAYVSMTVLLPILWIYVILVALGYVCSAILITNVTMSSGHLAMVNGAAASFSCLARSIGPLIAGPVFDWGAANDLIVLPFWCLGAVALAGAAQGWLLRERA